MENSKPNNPYAFPQTEFNDNCHPAYNGATLRDIFANSAMQGLLSNDTYSSLVSIPSSGEIIARDSYAIADAMLLEREKQQ